MRHSLTLLFLLTVVPRLMAQNEAMMQSTRDRLNYGTFSIPQTGVLFGVAGEPGKLLGNNYLDSTFQAGAIKFYGKISGGSDSLTGVPIRLDLAKHEIDVRVAPGDIRAIRAASVRYFDRNDLAGSVSRFINVREFRGDADNLAGFFEQVTGGKIALLQYHYLFLRRANYNAALNVGTKDDQLVKKSDWYMAGTNRKAQQFISSRKALLDLMTDKQPQVEAFLKEKRPDLKSRAGLAQVFDFYNTL